MRKTKNRTQKGFTLIELLIVIAIIGILASVVLVSLNSARQKAKSARKKTELSQIIKLVQIYYINENSMPANTNSGGWCIIGSGACLQELVTKGYTTSLPTSPDSSAYYYYNYGSYGLVASRMTPPEYGSGTRGWHCSNYDSDKLYCLEFNK